MIGLLLLLAVFVWFGLGWLLWRFLFAPRIDSASHRTVVGVVMAAAWLLLPWVDELLGAREFTRLCDEMPAVKFLGPVSIGAGPFFGQEGTPKWRTKGEFDALLRQNGITTSSFLNTWPFRRTENSRRVRDWPIPIVEQTTTYSQSTTGKPVRIDHWLGSPGGWIKRSTGWGNHAPYSCVKQQQPYPIDTWINY